MNFGGCAHLIHNTRKKTFLILWSNFQLSHQLTDGSYRNEDHSGDLPHFLCPTETQGGTGSCGEGGGMRCDLQLPSSQAGTGALGFSQECEAGHPTVGLSVPDSGLDGDGEGAGIG